MDSYHHSLDIDPSAVNGKPCKSHFGLPHCILFQGCTVTYLNSSHDGHLVISILCSSRQHSVAVLAHRCLHTCACGKRNIPRCTAAKSWYFDGTVNAFPSVPTSPLCSQQHLLSAIALCPPGQVRSGISPQFHLHSLLGLRWSLFQWVKFICISFSRNYSCHVSISLVRFLAFSYWFVVALWYDGISIPFLGYSFIFFFFMMISCFLVLFWPGKNILIFMESIFLFFYNLEGLSHTEHGVPILRL